MNPLRKTTTIVILKTTKTRVRSLAKDHNKRKGTETDESVLLKLLSYYEQNHPNEIREPKPTYRNIISS